MRANIFWVGGWRKLPAVAEDDHLGFADQALAVAAAEALQDPGLLEGAAIGEIEGSAIPVTHDHKNGHLVVLVVGALGEVVYSLLGFS